MKIILIFLLLCSACFVTAQDFRVKKINCLRYFDAENPETEILSFTYAGDQLVTVKNENSNNTTVYKLVVKKKKICLSDGQHSLCEYETDKEGRLTSRSNIELKYDKNGQLKEVISHHIYDKRKDVYKVLYDYKNRLAVLAGNKEKADANYLLYYNTDGKCEKVELGEGKETILAEWENGKLKKLSGIINGHGSPEMQEFSYNENGLLSEEKVYSQQKDGSFNLYRHYTLVYEPGKGNADIHYFHMRNWKINLFFTAHTCQIPTTAVY